MSFLLLFLLLLVLLLLLYFGAIDYLALQLQMTNILHYCPSSSFHFLSFIVVRANYTYILETSFFFSSKISFWQIHLFPSNWNFLSIYSLWIAKSKTTERKTIMSLLLALKYGLLISTNRTIHLWHINFIIVHV